MKSGIVLVHMEIFEAGGVGGKVVYLRCGLFVFLPPGVYMVQPYLPALFFFLLFSLFSGTATSTSTF